MRRVATLAGLVMALFCISPAAADTNVPLKITITEPAAAPVETVGCPVAPEGFCGTGIVLPFGRATEMIDFGAGCAGSCDLRTITLAQGSIVLEETFSDGTCPGSCHPSPAEPASGVLTDVIVGGSGIFARATGVLNGTVNAAGKQSHVQFAGTITLGN